MIFKNLTTSSNVILAPMAGVTDLPFRVICKEFGCGMSYTEMVSAKGLLYDNDRTCDLLNIDKIEYPVGAQLFGSDPDIVSNMAKRIDNVDFIDLNMGCPAPKITKNGEGSALLKNPELIGEIVHATVRAIDKPLTVKIRMGYDAESINAVEVAKIIQQAGAAAITLHGRTRDQFYSGTANWEIIKQVKSVLDIPLIGNGDVKTPEDAKRMMDETGCDAVMIGRAAQGNPWIFKRTVHYLETGELLPEPTLDEKIAVIIRHATDLMKYKGEYIGVREMRSHLTSYIKGINGATRFRKELTTVNSLDDIKYQLDNIRCSVLPTL